MKSWYTCSFLIHVLEHPSLFAQVILVGHDFGGACIAYAMELFPFRIAKAIFIAAAMLTNGQNTLDMFSQQVSLLICCLICASEIQILKLLVLESIAYVFELCRTFKFKSPWTLSFKECTELVLAIFLCFFWSKLLVYSRTASFPIIPTFPSSWAFSWLQTLEIQMIDQNILLKSTYIPGSRFRGILPFLRAYSKIFWKNIVFFP